MLKIDNLKIKYGNLKVINKCDLEFGVGVTCLIGPSGSGKSSILNAIANQILYDSDSYQVGDIDCQQLHDLNKFVREHYTYLVQGNNFISDLTCFENIKFYAKLIGKIVSDEDIYHYLDIVGLNIDDNVYPDRLSGGEKQRLAICLALAKDSDIILCDEITASLDGEMKLEIFNLLHQIAREMKKIVIITSHDEDIFELCDCIYEINNCVVNKIKTSNLIEKVVNSKHSYNLLNVKDFKNYIYEKIDRQKYMFLIYTIISALIVSLVSFLTYFSYDYVSNQNQIVKRLTQNQMFVVNQTTPKMTSGYTYYIDNQAFDDTIYEQLIQIDNIEAIYPYYYGTLYSDEIRPGKGTTSLKLIYTDKESKTIERNTTKYEYHIMPLFDELNFDEKMEIINLEYIGKGIYVNDPFLMTTGLTKEDLKGLTIETLIYLPVASRQETQNHVVGDETEGKDILVDVPIAIPVKVSLPVIGYVDYWYSDEWGNAGFYMPFDWMESLRTELASNYVLNENEIEWKPNCYSLFIDDLLNMEQVSQQVKAIDENIAVGNRYTAHQDFFKQNSYVKVTAFVSLGIVFTAGIVLSYVYGIYYYQKNEVDMQYFMRNGLQLSEFKKLIIYDCVMNSILIFVFGVIGSVSITYVVASTSYILWYGIFSLRTFGTICIAFISTLIQVFTSRIYYFNKVKNFNK